jgi:hypothetical protein
MRCRTAASPAPASAIVLITITSNSNSAEELFEGVPIHSRCTAVLAKRQRLHPPPELALGAWLSGLLPHWLSVAGDRNVISA